MATGECHPPRTFGGHQSGGLLLPIKLTRPVFCRALSDSTSTRKGSSRIRETKHRPSVKKRISRDQENRRIIIIMLNFQVFYAITLLAAIFLVGKCHPLLRQRPDVRPLCLGCGNECDKCEFGYAISTLCGIRECRRGPGQICGGPSEAWGVCGEGLRCSCNRCSGCSLDSLTCFENPCLPHLESRSHLEIPDGFPFDRIAK